MNVQLRKNSRNGLKRMSIFCTNAELFLLSVNFSAWRLSERTENAALIATVCFNSRNGTAASSALRKPAVSLADSTDLRLVHSYLLVWELMMERPRILLNVMYVMVETLRRGVEGDCEDWQRLRENFLQELGENCN